MNEQNKSIQEKEEAPKTQEGAQTATSFSWKRLLAKKWVFPATYMAAAAIILTLMWVYQDTGKQLSQDDVNVTQANQQQPADSSTDSSDAVPVAANTESMQWPVQNRNELEVTMPFFDSSASNEERKAAMVQYGDTFTPHVGIDLARQDNQAFDVLAAMSGKVTAVEQNPVVGNLVEITHSNGLVTIYQSLADVKVSKDAEVKKGDVIAKAGRSELEKDEGVHLHFEVRQGEDGQLVNPKQYLLTD